MFQSFCKGNLLLIEEEWQFEGITHVCGRIMIVGTNARDINQTCKMLLQFLNDRMRIFGNLLAS